MTLQELTKHFNENFGREPWPTKVEVDPITYANICQAVFDWHVSSNMYDVSRNAEGKFFLRVAIGPNHGIMFKNVELILKLEENEHKK